MSDIDGKKATGIVGSAMLGGYLPDYEDEQAKPKAAPKAKRQAKPKAAPKVKAAAKVEAPKMGTMPVHVGTKRDTLNAIRGQVLDMLELNGWLVSSGPDALFFAQGFEDLVKAHFAKHEGDA